MRVAAALIAAAVFAVDCGLPAGIDPDNLCRIDNADYPTLDADAVEDSKIWITMHTKAEHYDEHGEYHGGTVGGMDDLRDVDNRYVLHCPQEQGKKTFKITVHRPKEMTAFGAEWVQLFPKDSWLNLTTEMEPHTFNGYGAKIPLLRPLVAGEAGDYEVSKTTIEAVQEDEVSFYIEVSNSGDYEIRYGNPNLEHDGKWVAVEFKSTLVRIGTPWVDCGDEYEEDPNELDIATIIPAFFENPNLGLQYYEKAISNLGGTTLPTSVVIQIYVPVRAGTFDNTWTESGGEEKLGYKTHPDMEDYKVCYEAGNPCPEAHSVCKADYCNMDMFRSIIQRFRDASPEWINILGYVDVSDVDQGMADVQKYRENIGVDGFYFDNVPQSERKLLKLMEVIADHIEDSKRSDCIVTRECTHIHEQDMTVFALRTPLFNRFAIGHPGAPDVWITLYSSVTDMGVWTPFSWYPGAIPSKWGAMVFGVTTYSLPEVAELLYDRGYGNIFLHSENDVVVCSDHLFFMSQAIKVVGKEDGRRLATVAPDPLEKIRAPMWTCDDTRFECEPICVQTRNKVTVRLDDSKCTEPKDPCMCTQCYYDVKWSGQSDKIECMATQDGISLVVADTVCELRGSPLPEDEEQRLALIDRGTRGTIPQKRWDAKCNGDVQDEGVIMFVDSGAALLLTPFLYFF
jgi:hypothetical protein